MKFLYRVDEVAEMLSMSKRSVYRLLDQGELEGHNDSVNKKGLKITGESVWKYVEKHKIKMEGMGEEPAPNFFFRRKTISRGVE